MSFSFRRATVPFTFTLVVCAAFVLLTLGAMAVYPGGTAVNPHSRGYLFFENFFSDLGRTVARNEVQTNPVGSKLFFVALFSAGLALGAFFLAFARFFWGELVQRVFTLAGLVFGLVSAWHFVGIALTPANIAPGAHVHHVYAAFEAFPLAILFFLGAMAKGSTFPRAGVRVFGAFSLFLLAYLALLFFGPKTSTPLGLMIQATAQKMVVYASILCVGAQAWVARGHAKKSLASG